MTILLFCLLGLSLVFAQQIPQAQYKQGCELLGKKIYCFGGAIRDTSSSFAQYADSFNNNHYVLDLTNFTTDKDAANLQWQQVPPPSNQFVLEPRADFAHVKVSDNSYIVFGGAGSTKTYAANPNLKNLTTIYFADQNSWQTIPTGQLPPSTILTNQGFGGEALMDGNGTVWLFGGIPPSPQATSFNLNSTILKIKNQNPQWTAISATLNPPADDPFYPSFHHGAVSMRNGYIYSYGGISYSFAFGNYQNNYADSNGFFKLPTVNSEMYEFLVYNNSGNDTKDFDYNYVAPVQRELHTLTALPNSDTFLLYGGVSGSNIISDYCYTYDTISNLWTKITFQGGGPGPRYGHSAIAYGKDSVFVMFGANSNGNMLNDAYVLNTTTFTWTNIPTANNGTTSNDSSTGSSSVLGGGAIAGIVIGSIAVIAIIAGGGYFLYKRGVFNTQQTTATFTPPVYGNQDDDDDLNRPTTEKFANPSPNGQQQARAMDVYPVPLAHLNTASQSSHAIKPLEHDTLSSPADTDYNELPMKPMSNHYGDMHSSSYGDGSVKPHDARFSDEIHSTSTADLVGSSGYPHPVKPHGFE
ncbi:uncharacterized protein BX664DRAFT_355046 [Halteromyces radiatus]|uniref:uncharacterized protein n=1 Tax=Halteromyces radiatus TaxID=101107 RepID=UPI0022201DBE|nr:uncharacterized protein BX664DRAFT_355046 [Halteromyces radiatus]KAI8099645.1 hypothetical protein BX664DRAFT_355046 [Halteromyces radiatus]